jgi:uncharacterized protein YfaS (alpha-2-macroglobulin family)
MRHKKKNAGARAAALARVIKEIAEPRMTRSARIAERNLDTARAPNHPSVTMPGTVDKIIAPTRLNQTEKAQIAVDGAHRPHRNLRIENELIDEDGQDVRLKKGARVDVTVTAAPRD